MPKRLVLRGQQLEEVVALYKSGASLRFLAQKLGSSVPTIRRRLQDAGVTIRDRGRPKVENTAVTHHHPSDVASEDATVQSGDNGNWQDVDDNTLPAVTFEDDNVEEEPVEYAISEEAKLGLPDLGVPSRNW